MIVSPGRRFIFVHIPKTGGTSLAMALEARAMKDDILVGDTPKARKRRHRLKDANTAGRLWKHSTLADVDGLVPIETIQSSFCCTLVRNPWDRLVSYYHWLRVQRFENPAVATAKSTTFSEFLKTPIIIQSLQANPYQRYMRAIDGKEYATQFIRLEKFEEDAVPMWQHLGFQLNLPHENRSQRETDYRQYYSDSDAALVAQACAQDVARFGYSF